ncbi:MAG: MFS transporter [Phycisphaerae bacterium]
MNGVAIQRLVEFLGLRRSIVGMLLLAVFVGLGERLGERFLPIYLLALGGGDLAIGLLGGLNNLQNAIYSLYGGWLSDRLGYRRALLISNLVTIAGYLIVIASPSWHSVIVGSVLFLAWSAISMPATIGLVTAVLPAKQRTMGVSMHSLVRRVPMALGPAIGGILIDSLGVKDGVRIAFGIAIGLAIAALLVQWTLIAPPAERESSLEDRRHPLRVLASVQPALRGLLVSDILIRFCEQIPYAFVVIWCMKSIAKPVSASEFGMLTAIEMATALLVYIPVAYLADRAGKRPFVLTTFVFFTAFPLTLLFCHSFVPLVLAFVIRGLKEFGDAARKALIVDLAPPDRKELVFGVYYFIRDTVVSLAALAGAWLWWIGPEVNLIAATAFGVVGTVGYALLGGETRDAARLRER